MKRRQFLKVAAASPIISLCGVGYLDVRCYGVNGPSIFYVKHPHRSWERHFFESHYGATKAAYDLLKEDRGYRLDGGHSAIWPNDRRLG